MVVFFIISLNINLFEIEELNTSVINKFLNKSFYLNPGYLNEENKNILFLSYTNPYKLPSLNYFNFQTKFRNFGVLIQNLYYPHYNENRLSLIYAQKIKNFSYGFSPNFCYFKIAQNGDFFFTYHLGVLYDWQKLTLSWAIFNINKPKIWDEEIREKLILGIDFNITKNLTASSFYLKTKDDERFKIAFDFRLNENLSFGQESSFLPFTTNFKFDLLVKENFGIYYFLNFHYRLKDTHTFSLYFQW
ncbi:MAG: hypothetical protein N2323_05020 [candidate division WOR-3 bacterium]|nr:hypothetical protein [candidate division WOR-3 bacterium]MDW8114708.1 hypothetical protein [candidate division WOR-3 bacterium]